MKSIILYNVYPKNHWKQLTQFLLSDVPHDTIIVNVTMDKWDMILRKKSIERFLKKIPKVSKIYFTPNSSYGEVPGFITMRNDTDLSEYSILTYMHSKGVTKPDNDNIKDWVRLMHYFIIDKFKQTEEVFSKNYILYGVNLLKIEDWIESSDYGPYRFSDYHYSGNFVSVNLDLIRDKFLNTPVDLDYFGIEGFFGKLCSYEQAYSAHLSTKIIQSHYKEPYPESYYK